MEKNSQYYDSQAVSKHAADAVWEEHAIGSASNSPGEPSGEDARLEKIVKWKQDSCIVHIGAFIFLIAYFDRANIGKSRDSS